MLREGGRRLVPQDVDAMGFCSTEADHWLDFDDLLSAYLDLAELYTDLFTSDLVGAFSRFTSLCPARDYWSPILHKIRKIGGL